MITPDQEVISIGEAHQGTETTLVVTSSYARNYYDLGIREIIAKPHVP